jgi:RNA polymerase sigma-70 factor (ECF subfamily)
MAAFNQAALPHLDAAYNLARWLTRNDRTRRILLRKRVFAPSNTGEAFPGRDCQSWLLKIVRNTFYSWVRQRSVQPVLTDDGETDDTADNIPDLVWFAHGNGFKVI